MKKLEEVFERKVDNITYIHTQIDRTDFDDGRCICTYRITRKETGVIDAYEIMIPRLQKKDIKMPAAGYVSLAGEKYPGTNDFGTRAYYISGGTDEDKLNRVQDSYDEFEKRILDSIETTKVKEQKKVAAELKSKPKAKKK